MVQVAAGGRVHVKLSGYLDEVGNGSGCFCDGRLTSISRILLWPMPTFCPGVVATGLRLYPMGFAPSPGVPVFARRPFLRSEENKAYLMESPT